MAESLLARLDLRVPVIQAPMAGANATPPALIAAVSNAGGMGSLGAAYMSPEQIRRECDETRVRTSAAFGINLFAPTVADAPDDVSAALATIARFHEELSLPAPQRPTLPSFSFDDQLRAVIDVRPAVFSFTFGIIPDAAMRALRDANILIVGTATTVDEARQLEAAGVDAIVAQGSEAGGHRGTFASPVESAMIGTMALVPLVVDAVSVPVIASGGIMDGRAVRAALAPGAVAVQMGTAFLTTDECGVAESYKAAVLAAMDGSTRLTRAFSGRWARGIVNRAMATIEESGSILPYPYQNALTRPMRNAASQHDRAGYLSLWAGQAAHLAARGPAGALVERIARELA